MLSRQKKKTKNYKPKTTNWVVGIDEAGRGPLAGPLVVGAVAIPSVQWKVISIKYLAGIKDSKKLSPQKREEWFAELHSSNVLASTHVFVSHTVIDRIGIAKSARQAVSRCLWKLSDHLSLDAEHFRVLLDGSLYAPPEYKQKTIIKGDEKIPLISAASIIAKVTRDRKMRALHIKYPHYNFAQHKGYGTRAHFAAIRKHGLSPVHRRTFCARIV